MSGNPLISGLLKKACSSSGVVLARLPMKAGLITDWVQEKRPPWGANLVVTDTTKASTPEAYSSQENVSTKWPRTGPLPVGVALLGKLGRGTAFAIYPRGTKNIHLCGGAGEPMEFTHSDLHVTIQI